MVNLMLPSAPLLLGQGQQAGVAAGGRGVDGQGAFHGEAVEVVGPARLGAGARQPFAAEGLDTHHRAHLVAVGSVAFASARIF